VSKGKDLEVSALRSNPFVDETDWILNKTFNGTVVLV
jgi:hypothetical protein